MDKTSGLTPLGLVAAETYHGPSDRWPRQPSATSCGDWNRIAAAVIGAWLEHGLGDAIEAAMQIEKARRADAKRQEAEKGASGHRPGGAEAVKRIGEALEKQTTDWLAAARASVARDEEQG